MAESIGEQLKKARQAKNLSIEQASYQTHIRLHYVKALEEDDRASLPSSVQGKGFLRLYAGLLGLPVQPLLDQWDGKAPSFADEPPQRSEYNLPPAVDEPSARKPEEPEDGAEIPTAILSAQPLNDVAVVPPDVLEHAESLPPALPPALPTGSKQILVQIGQQLRQQREKLGLKIVDVESFTRVRQHYLNALEAGSLEDLPSPVQGRGMLSNYARFLELDVEALLLRFAEALQIRRIEQLKSPQSGNGQASSSPQMRKTRQAGQVKRFMTPDLMIGSAVIFLLFAFTLWMASDISSSRRESSQATLLPISEVMLTASLAPLPSQFDQPTPGPENNAVVLSEEGEDTGPAETPTLPFIGDDPLQVYLIASQRAWLKVTVDGEIKFEGRTIAGNAYPFAGQQTIELVTGNGAAIQVFYNRMDLGKLGNMAEVKRLVFNAEGVQTPTSQFTPTITPTELLTSTPIPSPTVPSPTVTPYIP